MDQSEDPNQDVAAPMRSAVPRGRAYHRAVPDAAFDIWLRHGLRTMYDEVAREPIPDDLLRLIEADREK